MARTNTKPNHIIIGAGFTGLAHAYQSVKKGEKVLVMEAKEKAGGLLNTTRTEYGLVESAANGVTNISILEEMASDIGLELVSHRSSARKRFIYTESGPSRFPLDFTSGLGLVRSFFLKKAGIQPGESLGSWGERVLGKTVVENLIQPAMGGIYAGDVYNMDARMIVGRFVSEDASLFSNMRSLSRKQGKRKKTKLKGLVGFRNGMGEWIAALERFLQQNGVVFQYGQKVSKLSDIRKKYPKSKITLAVPLLEANRLLSGDIKELKKFNKKVRMISIVTVTRFGTDSLLEKKGFGVLFPRRFGVRALGVLFNSNIFPYRSSEGVESETFIYGGALDPDISKKKTDDIIKIIEKDRKRIKPDGSKPLNHYVTVWKDALPVYDSALWEWNQALDRFLPPGLKAEGNYRRGIGLRNMLERSVRD